MALLDLSEVTRSIGTLFREAFRLSPAWGTPNPLTTHFDHPANVNAPGLSWYLYHVQENAHFKNMPHPGNDRPPVRFVPMPLTLYFQLSAHSIDSTSNTAGNLLQEQLMMGIAMKTLHDYPEITDATRINGVQVLQPSLRGRDNGFKIRPIPITNEQAVQFWTAGSSPVKLSAYYEISTIFLEPEAMRSYAGRVLQYGNYIFTEGTPQLIGIQNVIEFNTPDGIARQIKAQPAQVAPGSIFEIFGTGLNGDRIELQLMHSRWDGPALAGPDWNLALEGGNRLTATARETAVSRADGSDLRVLPGIYSAQVNVFRSRTLPNGAVREFSHASNQYPFTITPRIDNISPAGPVSSGNITLTGFGFGTATTRENEFLVYLGDTMIQSQDGTATLQPGRFRVTPPNTLTINLPTGLAPGHLPLRIVIAGAESPPRWIEITG